MGCVSLLSALSRSRVQEERVGSDFFNEHGHFETDPWQNCEQFSTVGKEANLFITAAKSSLQPSLNLSYPPCSFYRQASLQFALSICNALLVHLANSTMTFLDLSSSMQSAGEPPHLSFRTCTLGKPLVSSYKAN